MNQNTLDNGLKQEELIMVNILDESQLKRDLELSDLLKLSLDQVQKLPIAQPDSIRIFDDTKEKPKNVESLYSNYEYMNFPAYLRTLMWTSVTRRHENLFELLRNTKNKVCLDFGSGVGSHTIALLQNQNKVAMLDVPGKLLDFAIKRVYNRGYDVLYYPNNHLLPANYFDVVICTDVLEHVENPIYELSRIKDSLKMGGIIHLQVSTMIKPSSGHFLESINKWKENRNDFLNTYFKKSKATIYRRIK
jgi:2-polyprenyl-3-methyl-5-hydroxy-6-metoxy-1,4-benzoquinol methylase